MEPASTVDKGMPTLDSRKAVSKEGITGSQVIEFEKCVLPIHNEKLSCTNVMKGVDYIDGALTQAECAALCTLCDDCKELKFWSSAGRNDDAARAFRDADTLEVKSKELSNSIWERMKHLINNPWISIADDEDDENWERELVGDWEAVSVNFDLLFARYPSGGAFAPHTDGRAIHNFNTRSFSSVIIFLNDIPSLTGGGTRFYKAEATQNLQLNVADSAYSANRWTGDQSLILDTVSALAGRMLIFNQSMVHEGVPPSDSCKYIIRSDIMYERRPAICSQPKDLEAYKIFTEAEDLAEKGQTDDSIRLFRRAFKLSPDLQRIMGQG